MPSYSVVGDWDGERYCQTFHTFSPDAAEDLMYAKVQDEGGMFWPVATLLGDVRVADRYAYYVDRFDPRHEDRDDLIPAVAELEICEWTVFGRVVSNRVLDHSWNERTGGERWSSFEMAFAPDEAEDIARNRAADQPHARLLVCAVLPGRVQREESHAFCNRLELVR